MNTQSYLGNLERFYKNHIDADDSDILIGQFNSDNIYEIIVFTIELVISNTGNSNKENRDKIGQKMTNFLKIYCKKSLIISLHSYKNY